jgi:hypothetical protein
MREAGSEIGARRVWLRGLLFCTCTAPLLGALLAAVTSLALIWLFEERPPTFGSIHIALLIAVPTSYLVSTAPALVAGIVSTSLALRWRNRGISRRSIAVRLAAVGAGLGLSFALVAGSLAVGRLIIGSILLVPGAVTGLFVGIALPRVLWGHDRRLTSGSS